MILQGLSACDRSSRQDIPDILKHHFSSFFGSVSCSSHPQYFSLPTVTAGIEPKRSLAHFCAEVDSREAWLSFTQQVVRFFSIVWADLVGLNCTPHQTIRSSFPPLPSLFFFRSLPFFTLGSASRIFSFLFSTLRADPLIFLWSLLIFRDDVSTPPKPLLHLLLGICSQRFPSSYRWCSSCCRAALYIVPALAVCHPDLSVQRKKALYYRFCLYLGV